MNVSTCQWRGKVMFAGTAMLLLGSVVAPGSAVLAQKDTRPEVIAAPARQAGEGMGPFKRLVIRSVTVIDGTGGPAYGPMDVVIENNTIAEVENVGPPKVAIDPAKRPKKGDYEIDGTGMYLLPGFVDTHAHYGNPTKAPDAEYVNKLWLAHGVTTIRGVPGGPMDWNLRERARSARNEIVAPRIFVYQFQFTGDGWEPKATLTPELARQWVKYAAGKGVDGVKLLGADPEVTAALLAEAKKYKLGSVAHLSPLYEARLNARTAVEMGLESITHSYGLFESLYKDTSVQDHPYDYNYYDEQDRWLGFGSNWDKIYPRGSPQWNGLLKELLDRGVFMNPTLSIYSASRDLERAYTFEWHDKYTLPQLMDYFQPSRKNHGSHWFYWTSEDELTFRNYYIKWMELVKDYDQMGGKVTVGSDSGYLYQIFGFGYIGELEMLREAGLTPLEVFRSATLYGAQEIYHSKQTEPPFGIIRPGKLADLVLVDQNPLQNLKVLYGTGWMKLDDETGNVERVGGIKYTIKDGVVYDARKLLADVAAIVEKEKAKRRGTTVTRQGVPVVIQ